MVEFITALLTFLITALTSTLLVWGLWDDAIMPFFDVRDITFMESFYLNVVTGCLFKQSSVRVSNLK